MTQPSILTQPSICFIGAGNMAGSLIGGLISNQYPAQNIIACDINPAKLDQLQQQFQIQTELDGNMGIKQADIVILAVKPQQLQSVCRSITGSITGMQHKPLFISIAAGVREGDINHWLGDGHAIVRCMPNTPALVGLGASALYANMTVNQQQQQQAEQILQGVGITEWVDDESQLDAVTAISGSGPAYFFLFIEALQKAGVKMGLDPEIASRLARQTALGAATMALDKDVIELRLQVTSKGGTTEQAINSFQHNDLQQVVLEATQAAQKRSVELAEQLAN